MATIERTTSISFERRMAADSFDVWDDTFDDIDH
jgi:hypothetical protein